MADVKVDAVWFMGVWERNRGRGAPIKIWLW
jgi:hypothetical protein